MIHWLRNFARAVARFLPALLAICFAAAAIASNHVRETYEVDPDEGFNLMKIVLVGRGHALYREVWSDQPPLFTYGGVLFARIFGSNVTSVRLLTTLLAAGLVFALADALRREMEGGAANFASLAVALLLPLGARFRSLSMAAMVGLPAIALMGLSLWAIVVARSRTAWLAVAGVLFALSLGTKLFTIFLLPAFAIFAAWPQPTQDEAPGRASLIPFAAFMGPLT